MTVSRAVESAPRITGAEWYVYVIEVVRLGVKVGITRDPRRRITTLRREAATYGFRLRRIWLSPPRSDARRVEERLIKMGGLGNKREYLHLDYDAVVTRAQDLTASTPSTALSPAVWRAHRCAGCGATPALVQRDGATYSRTDHADDCPVFYLSAITPKCTLCGTQLLNAHNLIRLCRECGLVIRNERAKAVGKQRI